MISQRTIRAIAIALVLIFGGLPTVSADDKKKKLKDSENPLMVGKRDLNNNQINFYSLDKEMAIGRQLAAEAERQLKLIDDPVITEYINRVGQNIVLNSDAKIPFTIKVVKSDEVNAFALPGGFFYINSGLILAADNEAELAGVMAHEIAHVAARHGAEQASKGQLFQFGSIPLIFLGGLPGVIAQNAANVLVPMTFLKFSRGAEEEADRLGAQYAWAAGYDPAAMITFFKKLEVKEKSKPGTISTLFRSHPPTHKRIEKVSSLIDRFPPQEEYKVNSSEFAQIKARLADITRVNLHSLSPDGDGPRRPTLKRRKPAEDQTTAPDSEERREDIEQRPMLKRRPQID